MTTRRYLALVLPCLSTDRLTRIEPALAGVPFALWAEAGNRRLLTAVNFSAARALSAGTPLADATAMVPALVTRQADPAADAALLEQLARWATRYTPLAAVAGTDALVLDILGCAHPFGSEENLLHDATRRLNRASFTVCATIAETAAAALALARAGKHGAVVPAGRTLAAVAPLPVAVLGLDPELRQRLEQFGIASVGALAAQPRGALSRRVGPAALAVLDVALGRAPHPIRPLLPAPDFSAAENFAEPILTAEAIGAALDRLMQALCGQMEKAGQGARRVTLACFRSDGQVARAGIGTGLASRDAAHLARLLRPRIEILDPGFGIDRMVLAAEVVEALGKSQSAFTDGITSRAARRAELAQLLDRLRVKLGAPAVHRLALRESHIPERAVLPTDPLEDTPMPKLAMHKPRPVRLFVPAEPISVVSLLPDGPPRRFRWRDRVIAISRAEGPERIAPEWWREDAATARDYWRVETETLPWAQETETARYWLYRDQPARWFLHGLFG
jgi:protein ImuB